MKFLKRLAENDDPNTGRLAVFSCMCLLLFIGLVGIGSQYSARILGADADNVKDVVSSDTDDTPNRLVCDTRSPSEEGDLVSASCEQDRPPKGDVPL
jgi:hypothetical protein